MPPMTTMKMMSIVQSVMSYRDFSSETVTPQEVASVLELVATAPSAWNLQPWRFVVISDQPTKDALQGAAFNQKQVGGAQVVVALYTAMVDAIGKLGDVLHPSMPAEAKEAYGKRILGSFEAMTPEKRDEWGQQQGNIALGYLILLLELHGMVSSPMLGFDPPAVRKILNLPEHARIPALVAVGKPAAEHPGPQHRLPLDQLVRFVG